MFKISLSLKGFILSKPIMLISPNQFGPLIFNAQELTKNIKFEYIFGNISFILLFIAVLLYWFDLSNNKPASKQLKSFCMLGSNFALTILLMIRWWESGHFPLSNLYESLIGLSWGFTAVHLIITLDQTNTITERFRYKVSPLTKSLQQENENFLKAAAVSPSFQSCEPKESQYNIVNIQESLGYPTENNNTPEVSAGTFTLPLATQKKETALSTLLSNRGIKKTTMNRSVGEIQHSSLETSSKLEVQIEKSLQPLNDKIGTITAPAALLISVFATFFLPPDMLRATTLIPALKSNWLTMHVTLMVLSYAFLLIGSLLSIAFCAYQFSLSKMNFKNKFSYLGSIKLLPQLRDNTNNIAYTKQPDCTKVALSSNVTNPLKFSSDTNLQSEICSWLNTTSYRILGLGFPLLTIGILSGAVWANEAWGSYWSWDPKETWALITWLVFAIYFHSRYNRSSDSSIVPASIASVGFVVIWICYLGVNLLGTGLHSYGWFQGVN